MRMPPQRISFTDVVIREDISGRKEMEAGAGNGLRCLRIRYVRLLYLSEA